MKTGHFHRILRILKKTKSSYVLIKEISFLTLKPNSNPPMAAKALKLGDSGNLVSDNQAFHRRFGSLSQKSKTEISGDEQMESYKICNSS